MLLFRKYLKAATGMGSRLIHQLLDGKIPRGRVTHSHARSF